MAYIKGRNKGNPLAGYGGSMRGYNTVAEARAAERRLRSKKKTIFD